MKPESSLAYNSLAWLLATCPDPERRKPAEAVAIAMKAVELTPKESTCWNTLGVAHYRNGQWTEAIRTLKKSMELGSAAIPVTGSLWRCPTGHGQMADGGDWRR